MPQLRWLAYHRDAATRIHYRRFTIPKRDGTERAIWAPLPKLKAAQRWILRNIVEKLPVHGAAHGFLPGRSIAHQRRGPHRPGGRREDGHQGLLPDGDAATSPLSLSSKARRMAVSPAQSASRVMRLGIRMRTGIAWKRRRRIA